MTRAFICIGLFTALGLLPAGAASAQSFFEELQAQSDAAYAQEAATRGVPGAEEAWQDGVRKLRAGIDAFQEDMARGGGNIGALDQAEDCGDVYDALASFNHAKMLVVTDAGEGQYLDYYTGHYNGENYTLRQMQAYIDQVDEAYTGLGCT